MFLAIEKRILMSRLLTRSGDQAWDFVVPLALLHIFPGHLQMAALYYLIVKLGVLLMTPILGRWVDRSARSTVIRRGIGIQFFSVLAGFAFFYFLDKQSHNDPGVFLNGPEKIFFVGLAVAGVLASLGSVITEISVGNDLTPLLVPPERLTFFNSWLQRVDLMTEVVSPILAGLLFLIQPSGAHLLGLFLVAAWNVISFVPEHFILSGLIGRDLLGKDRLQGQMSAKRLFGFDFIKLKRNPLLFLIFSNALLWLSVLSPHGVLLTGYLKDEVNLPEFEIGLFRGLGAIFGLISTLTFPYFVKRIGLTKATGGHLLFQLGALGFAIAAFATAGSSWAIYLFLAGILLSRIGLYGFSNGEFELRQRLIPEFERGELNSFSSAMTTFATLILFAAGSVFPQTKDFEYLVYFSLLAVALANAGYGWFSQKVAAGGSVSV